MCFYFFNHEEYKMTFVKSFVLALALIASVAPVMAATPSAEEQTAAAADQAIAEVTADAEKAEASEAAK